MKNLSLKMKFLLLLIMLFFTVFLFLALVFLNMGTIEKKSEAIILEITKKDLQDKIRLATNSLVFTLGSQFKGKDQEEQIKILKANLAKYRFEADKSGYFFAYEGTISRFHPASPKMEGNDFAGLKTKGGFYFLKALANSAKNDNKFIVYEWDKYAPDGSTRIVGKIAYAKMIPNSNLWLGTGIYMDVLEAKAKKSSQALIAYIKDSILQIALIFLVLVAILLLPLIFIIYKNISKGLSTLSSNIFSFLDFLKDNKSEISLEELKTREEFGKLNTRINSYIKELQIQISKDNALIEEAKIVSKEVKMGKYANTIKATTTNEALEELKASVNDMIHTSKKHLDSMNAVFRKYTEYKYKEELEIEELDKEGVFYSLVLGLKSLRDSSVAILKTDADFANKLEAKANELQASINTLEQSAKSQSNELELSTSTLDGSTVLMSNVSSRTDQLKEQSGEIKNVTVVIKDISDQISLLALNAAIEAARAGEHGRGFAVVADEVKNLAERTDKSLAQIVANSNMLIQSVDEMGENISEQGTNISKINDSFQSIGKTINDNESVVRATLKLSDELNEIAKNISKNLEDKDF